MECHWFTPEVCGGAGRSLVGGFAPLRDESAPDQDVLGCEAKEIGDYQGASVLGIMGCRREAFKAQDVVCPCPEPLACNIKTQLKNLVAFVSSLYHRYNNSALSIPVVEVTIGPV